MDPAMSIGATAEAERLRTIADDMLTSLYARAPRLIAATSRADWFEAKTHLTAGLGLLRYHKQSAQRLEQSARISRLAATRDALMAQNVLDIREIEARRGATLLFVFAQRTHRHRGHFVEVVDQSGEPFPAVGAQAAAGNGVEDGGGQRGGVASASSRSFCAGQHERRGRPAGTAVWDVVDAHLGVAPSLSVVTGEQASLCQVEPQLSFVEPEPARKVPVGRGHLILRAARDLGRLAAVSHR